MITAINTYHEKDKLTSLKRGKYRVNIEINKYILNTGVYYVNFHLNNSKGILFNLIENAVKFNVFDDNYRRGDNFMGEWPGKISLVPKLKIYENI